MSELSIAQVEHIFPAEMVGRLRGMFLCGNYGDPMVASDVLDVLAHFRRHNAHMKLKMHTNASGRDVEFWRDLAGIVDVCTFSLDGLGDTNQLYRRGTDWNRIMRNARAFISAGGTAYWDFIAFKHNEHQVEHARQLSRAMGFKRFAVRQTSRFWRNGMLLDSTPVRSRDGAIEYYLQPPQRDELLHEGETALRSLKLNHEAYVAHLADTEIACKAVRESQVYVSAEGVVFPCCWTAAIYNPGTDRSKHPVWQRIDRLPGGLTALSALSRSLKEVLEGEFFQEVIPKGWSPAALGPRLSTCASVCGTFQLGRAMTKLLAPTPG